MNNVASKIWVENETTLGMGVEGGDESSFKEWKVTENIKSSV